MARSLLNIIIQTISAIIVIIIQPSDKQTQTATNVASRMDTPLQVVVVVIVVVVVRCSVRPMKKSRAAAAEAVSRKNALRTTS